jgi:4-amino-4-deoxy-L-arabinose transferase-like glycosyltransferase
MQGVASPELPSASVEQKRATRGRLPIAVYLLAAFKFALTIAFSNRYGFHRDELYYLASARHPALGYVDYPPITPMLARLDVLVFGTSLLTLRLLPILTGSAIVLLAALIARELGGWPPRPIDRGPVRRRQRNLSGR